MTLPPNDAERRAAVEKRLKDLVPATLDALADLVAKGTRGAKATVKKYGLEAEIEQRLRDRENKDSS